MYRKCFQFSLFIKTCLPSSNSGILNIQWENCLQKRWAGHSKWQNIKNIKKAADHNKSVMFEKLTRLMKLAVKESGPDPSLNSKLKTLIEEAKKINMPKATIEKAIKHDSQKSDRPYWVLFSGPKGVLLGFEVTFANNKTGHLQNKFGAQTKKLKLKLEPHFSPFCNERGIIIASLENNDNSYEKALEDAIEIGIDEVYEDDDKSLIFECNPDRLESYSQQLMKKGYNIESLSSELDFKDCVTLQEDEIKDIEKLISHLKNQYEEVIRASYNVAQQ